MGFPIHIACYNDDCMEVTYAKFMKMYKGYPICKSCFDWRVEDRWCSWEELPDISVEDLDI